jgi:hypothetical protein
VSSDVIASVVHLYEEFMLSADRGTMSGVPEPDATAASEGTNWHAWHGSYADADSSLARRRIVVRRRIGEVLDAVGDRTIRVLSLCAGDGRDVLPELAARPSLNATAVLVERDQRLADAARAESSTRASRARIEVREGDAGDWATFADVLPVDLLLLCGIFGNVATVDIRTTIDAVPTMLAPEGTVIWTRGRGEHEDLRPSVRRWFVCAGLQELAFDGEPERFGVGVARATARSSTSQPVPTRLFTFVR